MPAELAGSLGGGSLARSAGRLGASAVFAAELAARSRFFLPPRVLDSDNENNRGGGNNNDNDNNSNNKGRHCASKICGPNGIADGLVGPLRAAAVGAASIRATDASRDMRADSARPPGRPAPPLDWARRTGSTYETSGQSCPVSVYSRRSWRAH
jgi:hypothetical protein